MANFPNKLIWKLYTEADVFISTLDDVISNLSIRKSVNGGDSEFTFELDRKVDDFSESTEIAFNNRVKVYLQNSHNPAGTKLVAYGYIVSYKPFLRDNKEGIEVTCLSAVSKLSNDFYRQGTSLTASNLGVELTSKRVDEMMEAIVDHYRSTETNSMISNDYTNSDSTTDNAGGAFSFTHRFFNMKHLDAIREASRFLPRNKTGGYWFYWRISTDGKLYVKNVSATADHTFKIGKHIREISGIKTIEGMVNRVYFWNEKGSLDPDNLKLTSDDNTSQASHDVIAEYITDSKITSSAAATLLASSKVYDKKDPKVRIKVVLNNEYDLSSIEPGETCQILNLKDNPYKIGADTTLIIHDIEYNVDSAVLELSEAQDNFEDIVEDERQRLDKEMRWFGYITQALTAAQLGPADRTWSTTIKFTATTGANAYRQVDWTAGIVYLPTNAGGAAGKRVIVAGNTGLMTADGTDYYIYLDEETFDTSATNADSGASGIIKEGGDALTDSGKAWSNDQYKGYIVTIGAQTKIIKSNTATVLTIEDRWTITDRTAAYTIKKMTLETTHNKDTISDLTKIIFSNVKAAVNSGDSAITTAEAVIVPKGNQSININGQTQISKRTILADRIVANAITVSELNFVPVADTNVIASINASVEGIRIDADNIHMSGSVTFSAGWATVANAEADINILNAINAPAEANADITSTHQAASIASQGALATLNSVNLATGEVTNKTAANIAETAALKWAAETGADITSGHNCQNPGDYTASNPQNYSWVTGSKPPTNADHTADIVSAVAYYSTVLAAMQDETIVVGGYIDTSFLTATNIQTGTLTGVVVRTAASGQRVIITSTPNNVIEFWDASAEQADIYGASGALYLHGEQTATNILIQSGSSGAVALYRGNSIKLETTAAGIGITGNLIISGTVDAVDIASFKSTYDSHASNASAHHVKTTSLAHSAITGVTASQHHSSTSNGLAITPASVNTSTGLITCGGLRANASSDDIGSSTTKFDHIYCTNIYSASTNLMFFATANIKCYKPLGLEVRSGTPGAASGWQGYMYFDTAQTDIVFSNGTNWYKVTATVI